MAIWQSSSVAVLSFPPPSLPQPYFLFLFRAKGPFYHYYKGALKQEIVKLLGL